MELMEMQLAVIIFLLGLAVNRLTWILNELKRLNNEVLKERRIDEK